MSLQNNEQTTSLRVGHTIDLQENFNRNYRIHLNELKRDKIPLLLSYTQVPEFLSF